MTSIKLKFRAPKKENKEGALYYQIIHQRIIRQIKTQYKIYPEEWDKDGLKITTAQTERANYISNLNDQIIWEIKKMYIHIDHASRIYTLNNVNDIIAILTKHKNGKTLFKFMLETITHLKELNKMRTSETYSTALNSFMEFRVGVDIYLEEIDSDLMQRYESYLIKNALTMNTTSFYMRILRATYNRAVEKELITQHNPFRHVYTGVDKTVKRAVTLKTIKQIKALDLEHSASLDFARDLFLFSFYTRGMSFVDIAYLKRKNLSNGILSYRRRKTNQQLFVKWEMCMQEILSKYENVNTEYLLSIISDPQQCDRKQYQTALGGVNRRLKKISEMVGLHIPLTMYVARHSWANIARCEHVPVSVISESMGHNNESTTQIYLASLDTSIIDNANRMILRLI